MSTLWPLAFVRTMTLEEALAEARATPVVEVLEAKALEEASGFVPRPTEIENDRRGVSLNTVIPIPGVRSIVKPFGVTRVNVCAWANWIPW